MRNTLFDYLSNDVYAKAQLAKHPQFAAFPEYQDAALELESQVKQLLLFTASGKYRDAKLMITLNPGLLLCAGETTDYSGKKRRGTPLQLALGAEDFDLYDNKGNKIGNGIAELYKSHLKRLPNGEEVIASQIKEKFPEGWEKQEEERHRRDLAALHKVREAIRDSNNNEACREAVLEFQNHVVSSEGILDWNAKLQQAAWEMGYKDYYYDNRKDDLFYNEVIGFIQTQAPANYAMAQAQGLRSLLEEGKLFKRDLKYHYGAGQYYPRSAVPGFRLGVDSWVECYFGQRRVMHSWDRRGPGTFQSYVRAKTSELQRFMPQPSKHSKPRCVIQ